MVERREFDPNGIHYRYWSCEKCGEEVLDMEQLHESALAYRKLKKLPSVKISKWGNALAIRIPKEVVQKERLRAGETAIIRREKTGFRVIPEKIHK